MKEPKLRILVVDDNPKTTSILKDLLEKQCCEVYVLKSPSEAFSFLEKNRYVDIVITGIQIRELDKQEVLKMYRLINPDLYIIYLFDIHCTQTIVEALNRGANDYLEKPINENRLISILDRAWHFLRENRTREGISEYLDHFILTLTLQSGALNIGQLQEYLRTSIHNYTYMNYRYILNILQAVEEAVLNAHEHGNLELKSEWKDIFDEEGKSTLFEKIKDEQLSNEVFANRKVMIKIIIKPAFVQITIKDDGTGFCTCKKSLTNVYQEYGKGIAIMNHLMDSVKFNNIGNQVTIRKYS